VASANRGPLPTSANPRSSYTLRNKTVFSCIDSKCKVQWGAYKMLTKEVSTVITK